MTDSATLHDRAMELADAGDAARRSGEYDAARELFRNALQLERDAAEFESTEPSRSILFRSAAWLALEAEEPQEAERLAACGLATRDVPDRLRSELRAVAEEARMRIVHTLR